MRVCFTVRGSDDENQGNDMDDGDDLDDDDDALS